MRALDGLAKMGLVLNPQYVGDWPFRVGQYMLNFAAIELFSYQHLLLLEPSRADFDKNLDRLLSHRIDRLTTLVTCSKRLDEVVKADINSLWSEARELSIWRNRIAHNPVLPTWKPGSDSEKDPPDLLGIPDMKQLKSSEVSDSISLEGMVKLVDASAELGQRLHAITPKLNVGA
jgi:hypothetical protein